MDGLIKEFHVDKLHVSIYKTRRQMGMAASAHYLQRLEAILAGQPTARAVFAAAHSQDEFLAGLIEAEDAVFNRIEAFHMDEYIGLPADAPQRFGTFLSRAIFDRKPFRKVYLMDSGTGDGRQECLRYSELLRCAPLDIVSLGIGENGHIAFNDPHEARFDDPETVKITTLDEPCRQQQVHDGEFARYIARSAPSDDPDHPRVDVVPLRSGHRTARPQGKGCIRRTLWPHFGEMPRLRSSAPTTTRRFSSTKEPASMLRI